MIPFPILYIFKGEGAEGARASSQQRAKRTLSHCHTVSLSTVRWPTVSLLSNSPLSNSCPTVPQSHCHTLPIPTVPCPTVTVSRCPSVPLSHCLTVPLSHCLTVPLSQSPPTITLPYCYTCPTVPMSNCPTVPCPTVPCPTPSCKKGDSYMLYMSNCPTVPLSHVPLFHCHTVLLFYCPLSKCPTLSHCPTTPLSHCPTVPLSHSPNALLLQFSTVTPKRVRRRRPRNAILKRGRRRSTSVPQLRSKRAHVRVSYLTRAPKAPERHLNCERSEHM